MIMKLRWWYVLIVVGILYFSLFYMKRTEIEEVDIIRVLGIDIVENQYVLTGLINKNGGVDKSTSGIEIISAQGNTAYEAYENLVIKNKKVITLAHTSYFILGDQAAKKGMETAMNFLVHDETIKMNSQIFVLKDLTVVELLEETKKKEMFFHEDLEALSQKQLERFRRNPNTLIQVLSKLENTYSSVLVPYLIWKDEYLYIDGYGIFEDKKLYDYLNYEVSMGIDFLQNNIRSYPIYIENNIGLELNNSKLKIKSDIREDQIFITISVNFETDIKEMIGTNNLMNTSQLKDLTSKQNEYIRNILEGALQYSKTTKLDVIGIARLLEIQHPSQWKEIRTDWKNQLGKIEYYFLIDSKTINNGNRG